MICLLRGLGSWQRGEQLSLCLAMLIAMASLCSCTTDQKTDVQMYRELTDPPGPAPEIRSGDPLSLVDALQLTALYNERLGIQGEKYIQALANRQRAAAALYPTFDFLAGAVLRENTGNQGIYQADLGFAAQYDFMTGLTDLRNVNAAEAVIETQRWLLLDLRESLLIQTALVYYETLRAERLANVLSSSVNAQTERLADAKARNEVGFARPLDVSQIESQVSRTRAQFIEAQQQASVARTSLAFLINTEIRTSSLVDGYQVPSTDINLDVFQSLARAHRQDVLAAHAEADAARSLVDAAIGEYAPSIGINLDYFVLGTPVEPSPSILSLLELRFPLFNAGRIEAQVRSAWSVFRARVLTYQNLAREVERDVQTAYLRVTSSLKLAEEFETQVRVASQAVELAEASYQAGLGTNLERIVAQDQLLAAELEAVSESFVTKARYLELLRACGLLSSEMVDAPLPPIPDSYRTPPSSPFVDRKQTPLTAQDSSGETR